MMQENIRASVIWDYKAKTLLGIEPFDNASDDRQRFYRVPLALRLLVHRSNHGYRINNLA